jgi:hypothetical protein
MTKRWSALASTLAVALLAGCSAVPIATTPADISASPWASESSIAGSPAQWRHMTFPGKAPTLFNYDRKDGRNAIAVQAASSVSMLRKTIRIEPADLGSVRFSWKVPGLIAGADMALRDADDSPVRLVLVFEGDRSRFSARDRMLSELVRTVTGEELPYATLMYVWCNKRQSGTVITGARSARIRKLVVQSGAAKLNQWLEYDRDIRGDFEMAFGEPPGALVGIGIMSDSDNMRTTASAWYGPVRLGSIARK